MGKVTWDQFNRERPAEFSNYEEAWLALSNGIIKQACDDWKKTRRLRKEIAAFIQSDYFRKISNIDPDYLLKMLEETYPTPQVRTGMVKG